MQKGRIAFIAAMEGEPWGGSEILWSSTALKFAESGHSVFVSVKKWYYIPNPIKDLISSSAQVSFRDNEPNPFEIICHGALGIDPFKTKFRKQWKNIASFRPDLIIISSGSVTCGVAWMKKCIESNIPFVTIAQSNFEQWWFKDELQKELQILFSGAITNYFVSKANLNLFEEQLGIRLKNAAVIWNPVKVKNTDNLKWPSDHSVYKLACVARLNPGAKGQDLLIKLMSLPKWKERNIQVCFYGEGVFENSLRNLVKMYGVEEKIVFSGFTNDIEGIWNECHAFILPSRYEGLPLALIEAMLCKRMPIVTNVAGNPEVVNDSINGYLAQSPTVEALDEALERAWINKKNWETIGLEAQQTVRKLIKKDPILEFFDLIKLHLN